MPRAKRGKLLFRWSYDEHGHAALSAVEFALTAAGVKFTIVGDDDNAEVYEVPDA